MVCLGGRFPILSVEWADLEGRQIDAINATDVEGPPAWVESRANERVDSAKLAEEVLGGLRIELIQGEIRLSREDPKVCVCRGVPQRTRTAADRAVAIDDVAEVGASLERDATTMARALIGLHPAASRVLVGLVVDKRRSEIGA
jgi:hypothetical protein